MSVSLCTVGSSSGGGITNKFQEFNSSGTFTPPQALIDSGGYIEVFLVGGGGCTNKYYNGAGTGGEVLMKSMYLTSTSGISVVIGAGGGLDQAGSLSSFSGASAGGQNITANGGSHNSNWQNKMGAGFAAYNYSGVQTSVGSGVLGWGAGGGNYGVRVAKANSGQGVYGSGPGGSGYCLIKWYE